MNHIDVKEPRSLTSSAEGEIDRQSEKLLARIVAGDATANDKARFRELSIQRSYLMKRKPGSALAQSSRKASKYK